MDYTQKTKEILDRIEKETGISRNVAAAFLSMYLLCGREHEVKEKVKKMLDIADEELDEERLLGLHRAEQAKRFYSAMDDNVRLIQNPCDCINIPIF